MIAVVTVFATRLLVPTETLTIQFYKVTAPGDMEIN